MSWRDGSAAAQWIPVCNTAETKYGIPVSLLARQCYQESRFNPDAHNPISSAVGLMQLLPEYFPGAGRNPSADIDKGAAYLSSLHKRFSDWQLALAGYDWGPTALAKWIKAGSILNNLPTETHNYVTQIVADVPVEGALCRTQIPQVAGDRLPAPSLAAASGPASPLSSTQFTSSTSRPTSIPTWPSPSQAYSLQGLAMPSLTAAVSKPQENIMAALSTSEQSFLQMIEGDVTGAFGAPGLTLLQSLIADKGDLVKEGAAIAAFVGSAPLAGLTLGIEFQNQLLSLAVAKFQAFVTAHPAP